MGKKALIGAKLVVILLTVQLLFTCCAGDDAANTRPADNNSDSLSVGYGENTFSGRLDAIPEDLSTSELADILLSVGIAPSTPRQEFQTDPIGRFYYSIDLSYAEPLCYTSSRELVCKLKNDSSSSMLIVLDAPTPGKVGCYLAPSWDISSQTFSVLMNGETVTEEEESYCRELFQIHSLGTGYQKAIILDGDVKRTEITMIPEPFMGITYTFFVKEYKDYALMIFLFAFQR